MSDQEFESYATLDISLINLYKGESAAFEKRSGGNIYIKSGKNVLYRGTVITDGSYRRS